MWRRLFGALLLTGSIACGSSTVEPKPLSITINATRTTAAPGDTISFVVSAEGGNLFGIDIDFGDTATDQFGTGSARSARVTFHHAYVTAGTFTVRAVVTDAVEGQKDASIDIRVN